MILGTLMQARGSIDPGFTGIITNDDNVLAINISGDPAAHPDTYAVVQGAITGVDAQMGPTNQSKTYIRAGTSTTKTATNRTFKATGDRYVGDDFQDYAFSHEIMYGVGQTVVTDYVWFNLLNGKGERGKVSVIVNSDGSGNAGETAGIDVDLQKTQNEPEEYTYAAEGSLTPIAVTSVAASASGETTVTVTPALPSGMTALYTSGAAPIELPAYDEAVTGWQPFTSGQDYPATTGHEFAVAYVDSQNKAKYAGKTTVTAAE